MYGIVVTNTHALKELRDNTDFFEKLGFGRNDVAYMLSIGVRGKRLIYISSSAKSREIAAANIALEYFSNAVVQHGVLSICNIELTPKSVLVHEWEFETQERLPETYPSAKVCGNNPHTNVDPIKERKGVAGFIHKIWYSNDGKKEGK